ncbi:MAG: tRNA (adenosine(37)-N6)-dimethylallyltransferase MiaA [Candidatus Pelagibacter sp.]|nr:tRNA (adenosine(37)-N6)-dimethylallyltransferase MiaA [Candidatus Pelagibacter sp.]|tara:strand:- start:1643 stop:2566 length:924 start_codon:yes stop_codon:yes gene_type:complete
MSHKEKVILLSGPTGSGKSDLAIKLAKLLDGEIINSDSIQVYKDFEILSSRPKKKDIKKIKHHLYGIKSAKSQFTTGDWLKIVKKKIDDCFKRKKIPILVGGTGLYFKALTDGLIIIPKIPLYLRNEIRKVQKKIGQKNFYKKLLKLDPLVKLKINSNDVQRSIRAYEIKKFTGKSITKLKKNTKPIFEEKIFKKIFLDIPRPILHKKINLRVEKMFKEGAVKEVKKILRAKSKKELSSYKTIGFREIELYLNNLISINEAKEKIKIKTRQYAKRQFTWSRGHMKSWNKIFFENNSILLEKVVSLTS